MYAAEFATSAPSRLAIVMAESGDSLTFEEYEAYANRVAHWLRSKGIERGDRIAVISKNSLEMLVVEGAAERIGAYYALPNPRLTEAETTWIINDSGARIVFLDGALTDHASTVPDQCPAVESWVSIDSAGAGAGGFARLAELVASQPSTCVPNESQGSVLSYSAGTTGLPKGIVRPLPTDDPSVPPGIIALSRQVYQMQEGMVFLSPAPLYHSAPQVHVASTLRVGGTAVVMERFDPEAFLQHVERYRVTHTALVPTMMSRLLDLPETIRSSYDISSLTAVVHGAAPCPADVKRRFIEWVGRIVWENFGSSEAIGGCLCSSEEWLERPGTVGKAIFGRPLILRGDGTKCEPDEIGEIWFETEASFDYTSASAAVPFQQRNGATVATVGDIGYMDEDGYLFPTDRSSFTIISGGVNIYPRESEEVLITHKAVRDVAVIGIADPDLGEVPHAVVELREGYGASADLEAELLEFCRSQIARYKVPRAVSFSPGLPRLDSGKMNKRALKASLTTTT